MRTLPSIPYSGITIIIDKPSRFDIDASRLLAGPVEEWLETNCITPLSLSSCDLRDATCNDDLLPNTTNVFLLGELAAQKYASTTTKRHGYPAFYLNTKIPATIGYYPQDCCDPRQIESHEDEETEEEKYSDRDTKDSYPTARKNHRFWTAWHIKKVLSRRRNNIQTRTTSTKIQAVLNPYLQGVLKILNSTTNAELYLDIETSRAHRAISCIGFSTTKTYPAVYVVPVYDYTGALVHRDFHLFHRALSRAFTRNTVVVHNASFDLLILHGFYKTSLPAKVYDTMLANHRIFPEAEKSLAHCIAQWTTQPYHKNVSTETFSANQERDMWQYNANDVYVLKLIKDAQQAYCTGDAGVIRSIQHANDLVAPHIQMSLTGMNLHRQQLLSTETKLLKAKHAYAKITRILLDIPTFNPGSTQQCAEYFHDRLHYPVVSRTEKKAPALGKKQLHQLMLKHNNPAIPVILKYRKTAKDASALESELFTLP